MCSCSTNKTRTKLKVSVKLLKASTKLVVLRTIVTGNMLLANVGERLINAVPHHSCHCPFVAGLEDTRRVNTALREQTRRNFQDATGRQDLPRTPRTGLKL